MAVPWSDDPHYDVDCFGSFCVYGTADRDDLVIRDVDVVAVVSMGPAGLAYVLALEHLTVESWCIGMCESMPDGYDSAAVEGAPVAEASGCSCVVGSDAELAHSDCNCISAVSSCSCCDA